MPFPPWGLCVSWNSGLPLVNVWGFWRVFGRSFVLLIREKTQWYDGESRGNPNVFGLVGSCNRGRVRPSTYLFGKIFSDPNFYCSCPGIWVSDSGSQLLRPTEISRSWKIECVWMRKWAFFGFPHAISSSVLRHCHVVRDFRYWGHFLISLGYNLSWSRRHRLDRNDDFHRPLCCSVCLCLAKGRLRMGLIEADNHMMRNTWV